MAKERVENNHDVSRGLEKTPENFGWYYMHFLTQHGVVSTVVHQTDIFGLKNESRVSLSMISPEGDAAYFSNDNNIPSIDVSSGRLDNDDFLLETEDGIEFNLPLSETDYFRGKMIKLSPSYAPNKGVLHQNSDSSKDSNWEMVVPHGKFEAKLVISGQEYDLSGTGYVDRQWGKEKIQDFARHWVWGHFSSEDESIVFFDLVDDKGNLKSMILVSNKSETTELQGINVSSLGLLATNTHPEESKFTANISVSGNSVATFDLDPENLMRKRVGEDGGKFKADYLRWKSELKFGEKTYQGITEYMHIEPNHEEEKEKTVVAFAGYSGAGKTTLASMLGEQGFKTIESKKVYSDISRSRGYSRSRDWLKAVGEKEFLHEYIGSVARSMWESDDKSRFVLDVAMSPDVRKVLNRVLPGVKVIIVDIEADKQIRRDRIKIRQNIPTTDDAEKERAFRDGFLTEAGVDTIINNSDGTISNTGSIEDAYNQLLEVLSINGIEI